MKSGSLALVFVLIFQSAAFGAPPSAGVTALGNEARVFRAQLDGGLVDPRDAIEAFAQALAVKNVTLDDVDAYARSRFSAREYRDFSRELRNATQGIEKGALSERELGQIVAQTLGRMGSTGLSWSSCTTLKLGLAVAIAGLIVAIIGLTKGETDEAIREEHEQARRNTRFTYGESIELREDWRKNIPIAMNQARSDIANNDRWAAEYAGRTGVVYTDESTGEQTTAEELYERYKALADQARRHLSGLQELFTRYEANPDLALTDIAELVARRDARLLELDAAEVQSLAEAPGIRAEGRRIAVGGAIGFGVGAGLTAIATIPSGEACEWY